MIPPFKEKSHFLEKVVLLARRSAGKRNKIARSFGGEGNRIARSSDRKGIGLIVDVRGREWIPPLRVEMLRKSLKVSGNES